MMKEKNIFSHIEKYVEQIGPELKSIRTNLKLSQRDVAEKAQIHESTVRRIENGEAIPDYYNLLKLKCVLKEEINKSDIGFRNDDERRSCTYCFSKGFVSWFIRC